MVGANILLLVLAACGSDLAQPTILRVADHTFEVVTVDGRLLPVNLLTFGRSTCGLQPLGRATIAFQSDGTFRLTHWVLQHDTIAGSVFATNWTQNAAGLVLISDGGGMGSGTVHGDTLALDLAPSLLFCERHTLVATTN